MFLGGLHDLPVCCVAPSRDTQQDENGYKKSLCVEPLVKIVPDRKTKKDWPHHGQPELGNQGYVVNPFSLFLDVKDFY